MKIYEITTKTPHRIEQLVEVWEQSVRATHLFLSDVEIRQIKTYVPQAISGVSHLILAENEAGQPVAFMGTENTRLEMLFLLPQERGKGLGKQMLQYGIEHYGIEEVTVNEQNPEASCGHSVSWMFFASVPLIQPALAHWGDPWFEARSIHAGGGVCNFGFCDRYV